VTPRSGVWEKTDESRVRTDRPPTPPLELVQERRFDAKNKRHRKNLRKDDSLLEYVRGNGGASPG
jgi:hypothetical protein